MMKLSMMIYSFFKNMYLTDVLDHPNQRIVEILFSFKTTTGFKVIAPLI